MTSTDWPVDSLFARRMKEEYAKGYAEGWAEGFAEGFAKGWANGTVRALLRVLAVRGLDVPDDIRTRITDCTDIAQLETWVTRAVTAPTIQDLFTGPDEDHQGQG